MKLGMVSLGCPKNLVDSEVMLGIIRSKNLEVTNNPKEADIIIVNTCGFIESAKTESIDTILQMAEYKKSGCCKHLIMTGCLSQRYADKLFEGMPEVDAILGTESFQDIYWVIEKVLSGQRVKHLQKLPESLNVKEVSRYLSTPGYMAYLKIAEGCDNRCSYCAIPLIRGAYVSRPYDEILSEAKHLAANGVKEIIVVAQDTTRYGIDLYNKLMLPQLLEDLNAIEELEWIRVMYLYPNNFTDELIEAFATLPKVCKYVDIPLQHASDSLLYQMNRFATVQEVETLLNKLRKRIPDITLRTTFIVGFPGETDADFEELYAFVARQRFENASVFTYSPEDGTEAGERIDQVEETVKEERYHRLMSLQASIAEEIHREREEEQYDVIVEGFAEDDTTLAFGRSCHEAPDVDGKIFIENAADLKIGSIVKVRIVQGFTYEMVGELV